MRPEPHARAIAKIVRDLIDTRTGATYYAQKVGGVWLRYDLPGKHPLIGRSAPDLEFEDGTRLGELLHDGLGLLLDLDNNQQLRTLSAPWAEHVKYISTTAKNCLGLTSLLVRPDGFVVWVLESEHDAPTVSEVLTQWFGAQK
jgi:hypothetical protein